MAEFREDPYAEFNFLVEADDLEAVGFSEVSGLGLTIDVIEYRNGNEKENRVRKLPGLTKYSNVTLKRGVIGDLAFWDWIQSGVQGQVQRRQVTISLLDEARNTVLQWRLERAWICKYEGPSLNAGTSEVAIETLELCHEGLELR